MRIKAKSKRRRRKAVEISDAQCTEILQQCREAHALRVDLQQYAPGLVAFVLRKTGLTNQQLAAKLQITGSHLSNLKNGRNELTLRVATRLHQLISGE